jgi:hypothetical protein
MSESTCWQALEELENGSDAESVEDSEVDSDEGEDVDFDEVLPLCSFATRPCSRPVTAAGRSLAALTTYQPVASVHHVDM